MPDDIINKVISFISGDSDSGSDKDVLLKQLAREISQNKYAKFYRIKQEEADPVFAQYFFRLYKVVYPLQVFLKDPVKDAKIRQITLEAFLDKHAMDMIRQLSPDGIAERKKNGTPDLTKQLEEDLGSLTASFDNPKIAVADNCYNLIASMKQFVFCNFTALLRKFDPEFREGDFLTQPRFAAVEAGLLVTEIAGFLSVLPLSENELSGEGGGWKTVFEILKYCNGGTDVISLVQWNSLLLSLKDLKQSRILELICRLATGNPIWETKSVIPHETLSASFLESKTREIREVIAGIAGSQKNSQIKALENAVFGVSGITRLQFYTPEKGRVLVEKELESYVYAPALNHLSAFIHDYLDKEIEELCDILLIRGQWTDNAASRTMSESYHAVVEIAAEITTLDETLDEEGRNGPRLHGALLKVDRDKTQARYINSIVSGINEEALHMINRAVPSLITMGKYLKMLMDDYEKKPFELIINWKELMLFSKLPLIQRISAAYKKVNYFVQLMLLETRSPEEP